MSVFRLPLEVDALLFLSFLFIGFYMCDCFKVRFLFDFIAYRRYCSVSFISAWCICFVTSVFFICFVIIDILLHLSVVHSMYFINGLFFFIYCIYSFILLYSVHALKNQNSVVQSLVVLYIFVSIYYFASRYAVRVNCWCIAAFRARGLNKFIEFFFHLKRKTKRKYTICVDHAIM